VAQCDRSRDSQDLVRWALAYRGQWLTPEIWALTGGRVSSGPFRGLQLRPEVGWGDGDLCAKLLGAYEHELHEILGAWLAQPRPSLVIGAAEGYYAVGLARAAPVWAWEPRPDLVEIMQRTWLDNPGLHALTPSTHCEPHQVQAQAQDLVRCRVFMDCEGAEAEYLARPDVWPRATEFLVESHDCFRPGIGDHLIQTWQATHECTRIWSRAWDVWAVPGLEHLTDLERVVMITEQRPQRSSWIHMRPRATEINQV